MPVRLKKPKIVIIKNYYPIDKDTRVLKLLKILNERFDIIYLGWNRDYLPQAKQNSDNGVYQQIIMQKVAPYGFVSYLFLPFWWLFVINYLLKIQWDAIHVINFPSVTPAIIVGILKRKPVVYDIEDTTMDQLPFRGFLRTLGIYLERLHSKFVTAVVLVDELQDQEFYRIPNQNVTVIYDSPPYVRFPKEKPANKTFRIFYAGYLDKQRNLHIESVLEAVKGINNANVTIVGEGNLVDYIKDMSSKYPEKITYLKWLPYDKVIELSCGADLLFSLREPYPLVNKYICGSKFLEATMCGKPILVNKGTSTAIKVAEDKCGIIVDAHDIEEVTQAILRLMNDKKLSTTLALNSENAYNQKYSWERMKERLLQLYAKVLA